MSLGFAEHFVCVTQHNQQLEKVQCGNCQVIDHRQERAREKLHRAYCHEIAAHYCPYCVIRIENRVVTYAREVFNRLMYNSAIMASQRLHQFCKELFEMKELHTDDARRNTPCFHEVSWYVQ